MITWTEYAIARKASQLLCTAAERPLTPLESRTLDACRSFADLLAIRESLPDDGRFADAARRAPPRIRKGSIPRRKKMAAVA